MIDADLSDDVLAHEMPPKPGWYWMQILPRDKWSVVHVSEMVLRDMMIVRYPNGARHRLDADHLTQSIFVGPLEEPTNTREYNSSSRLN